ncbi:MAG: recombinase family protein [Dysosmobacter sp.]
MPQKDEQLGSYENQKAYYTEKIMVNPDWTMADIFADEGITGTSACKRKDFLRMIRQCRQGKIDMILAKSVSRFARNTVRHAATIPASCAAWASGHL